MKKLTVVSIFCLMPIAHSSFAGLPPVSPSSYIPSNGLFLGLGGGFNSIRNEQNITLNSSNNLYDGDFLLAAGSAIGPAQSFDQTQTTFAPEIQGGFFQRFSNSDYLCGFKLTYQYGNLTFTNNHLNTTQVGYLTSTEFAPIDIFTAHNVIGSTQTTVSHIFSLIPFIGRTFGNTYFYAGVGPALIKAATNINNVSNYIDIDGFHIESVGSNINFSNSEWLFGGVGQVGFSYFFTPNWFVDFNYTYEITKTFNSQYQANFVNTTAFELTDRGTFFINERERIINQAFSITLNERFG